METMKYIFFYTAFSQRISFSSSRISSFRNLIKISPTRPEAFTKATHLPAFLLCVIWCQFPENHPLFARQGARRLMWMEKKRGQTYALMDSSILVRRKGRSFNSSFFAFIQVVRHAFLAPSSRRWYCKGHQSFLKKMPFLMDRWLQFKG